MLYEPDWYLQYVFTKHARLRIERVQEEVTKAKKKYDAAVETLEKLMTRKREMQQKELLQAFADSGKSYEEILRFLSE